MLQKTQFRPGVIKDDTVYASKGYATDSDKIRWVRGRAESWPGCALDTDDVVSGAARAGHPWAANDGTRYYAFGTNEKLYAYLNTRLYDITPVALPQALLDNALETVAGSPIVKVIWAGHLEKVGNTVYISGATVVGGRQIGGTSGSFALNPFQTTEGSAMVLVNKPNHGLLSGDFITVGAAAPVGGVTVDGLYSISVYDEDYFTLQAGTVATASATGGGTPTFKTEKGYKVTDVTTTPGAFYIDIRVPALTTDTGGGPDVEARHELGVGNRHGVGSGGYGLGGYGQGPYGVFFGGNVDSEPRIWCLQNYGENLTANPVGGSLYQWTLDVSQRAVILPNAPAKVIWHRVTAERIIITMGCTSTSGEFDPMLMRWCDIENNTVWLPAPDNNAGDERLAKGSRIVAGLVTRGGTLVWTDTALYYTRFTGNADGQYASDLMGEECGLMGPNAALEQTGTAYWMTRAASFCSWSGGAPAFINSPMREWFAKRLMPNQQYEIFAFFDAANPAVCWLFPATPSIECNEYMRVDLPANQADPDAGWSNGTFDRTMWIDLGIFEQPIAISSGGNIYRQNSGNSDNGNAIERHVTFGVLEDAQDGTATITLSRVVNDVGLTSGTLQVTVSCKKWPNGAATEKGPYPINASTEYVDVRAKGRQMQVTYGSAGTNDEWRLGDVRYDVSGGTLR